MAGGLGPPLSISRTRRYREDGGAGPSPVSGGAGWHHATHRRLCELLQDVPGPPGQAWRPPGADPLKTLLPSLTDVYW